MIATWRAAALAAAATLPVPTAEGYCSVYSVSPNRAPIEGGQTFTLIGQFAPGNPAEPCTKVEAGAAPLCRLEPYPGTQQTLNDSSQIFPGKLTGNTTMVCGPSPAFSADGPSLLTVSLNGGKEFVGDPTASNPWMARNRVSLFHLAEVALDRRPYITESQGQILLRTDASLGGHKITASAELPAAGKRWHWDPVEAGGDTTLPLDLSALPAAPIHNDISITLAITGPDVTRTLTKARRFHRVPPPAAGSAVQPVQVDHSRRGLLVGGKPWSGVGWYVQTQQSCCGPPAYGQKEDPSLFGHLSNLTSVIRAEMVPRGINLAHLYGMQTHPVQEQLDFLDSISGDGFKVMYPLDVDNSTELERVVAQFKDHAAILGWYICDDCCGSHISTQAQEFIRVKNLDPYHVTIGAVNCADSWQFTDTAPSAVAAQPQPEAKVLPEGQQPALQLSLDVVMQENYLGDLPGGAQPGHYYSAQASPLLSQDGANTTLRQLTYGLGPSGWFRNGVGFEPLVNCPGMNMASGRASVSAMWTALLAAGTYSSLGFVYEPAIGTGLNDYPTDAFPWMGNVSYMVHYHADWAAFYAQRVRRLLPAIAAPFGNSTLHPTVEVDADPTSESGVYNVRARAWSTPGIPTNCTFLVVVNLAEDVPAPFSLVITPAPAARNATRLFDANYEVNISRAGRLGDLVAHGDTNIYSIGAGCPSKTDDSQLAAGNATKVFARGENSTACYRIPLAVRVPCDGDAACSALGYVLLAFAEARIVNCCDFGPKRISMSRSYTGGASWEPQQTVWTDPTNASSHTTSCAKCYGCDYVGSNLGAVVFDAHTKTVLLHFTFQPCEEHASCASQMVAESTTLGQSWTVRNITAQLRSAGLITPWNGGPGTGLQLPSGRLIIPGFAQHSQPIFSDTHGATYRAANAIPGQGAAGTSENQVTVLANGSLLVNMRNTPTDPCHCRQQAWSHDGGSSYGLAAPAPNLTDPSCQGSVIATESGGAHLLWVTNAGSRPPHYQSRMNGLLHVSTTGGETWDLALKIPSGQLNFEYSALIDLGFAADTKTQRLGLVFENGWTSNPQSGLRYVCCDEAGFPSPTRPETTPCGIVFVVIECVVGAGRAPQCSQA